MNGIASDGNFFGFVQRISFLGMESGKADERQQNQAVLKHKYFNSKVSKVVFIIGKL